MTYLNISSLISAYPEYGAPVNDDSTVAPGELHVRGVAQCRVHQPRIFLEECHGPRPRGELREASAELVVGQTFEPEHQNESVHYDCSAS